MSTSGGVHTMVSSITDQLKRAVVCKLKELEFGQSYLESEFVDYVMLVAASKQTKADLMIEELRLLLQDKTEEFVYWIVDIWSKLQKVENKASKRKEKLVKGEKKSTEDLDIYDNLLKQLKETLIQTYAPPVDVDSVKVETKVEPSDDAQDDDTELELEIDIGDLDQAIDEIFNPKSTKDIKTSPQQSEKTLEEKSNAPVKSSGKDELRITPTVSKSSESNESEAKESSKIEKSFNDANLTSKDKSQQYQQKPAHSNKQISSSVIRAHDQPSNNTNSQHVKKLNSFLVHPEPEQAVNKSIASTVYIPPKPSDNYGMTASIVKRAMNDAFKSTVTLTTRRISQSSNPPAPHRDSSSESEDSHEEMRSPRENIQIVIGQEPISSANHNDEAAGNDEGEEELQEDQDQMEDEDQEDFVPERSEVQTTFIVTMKGAEEYLSKIKDTSVDMDGNNNDAEPDVFPTRRTSVDKNKVDTSKEVAHTVSARVQKCREDALKRSREAALSSGSSRKRSREPMDDKKAKLSRLSDPVSYRQSARDGASPPSKRRSLHSSSERRSPRRLSRDRKVEFEDDRRPSRKVKLPERTRVLDEGSSHRSHPTAESSHFLNNGVREPQYIQPPPPLNAPPPPLGSFPNVPPPWVPPPFQFGSFPPPIPPPMPIGFLPPPPTGVLPSAPVPSAVPLPVPHPVDGSQPFAGNAPLIPVEDVSMVEVKNKPPPNPNLIRIKLEKASEKAKTSEAAVKCKYFPNCKNGKLCPFKHPKPMCVTFPNCTFGAECAFQHPPCRYQDACVRPDCIYSHEPAEVVEEPAAPEICKFHPECLMGPLCPYIHPKVCMYGAKCLNPTCLFVHPKTWNCKTDASSKTTAETFPSSKYVINHKIKS